MWRLKAALTAGWFRRAYPAAISPARPRAAGALVFSNEFIVS